MKNLLLTTLLVVFSNLIFAESFIQTYSDENKKGSEKEVKESKESCKEEPQARVTCSVEFEGTTYTASAGGLFTSLEKASDKCVEKLDRMLKDAQPDRPDLITD